MGVLMSGLWEFEYPMTPKHAADFEHFVSSDHSPGSGAQALSKHHLCAGLWNLQDVPKRR